MNTRNQVTLKKQMLHSRWNLVGKSRFSNPLPNQVTLKESCYCSSKLLMRMQTTVALLKKLKSSFAFKKWNKMTIKSAGFSKSFRWMSVIHLLPHWLLCFLNRQNQHSFAYLLGNYTLPVSMNCALVDKFWVLIVTALERERKRSETSSVNPCLWLI